MISRILQRPYPFIESSTLRLSLAFIIGLVVFLLLNTYRPFGIETIPKDKTAFIAGLGMVAFIALTISLFLFPKLLAIEKWTIQSEALLHIFNWVLTSSLVFIYNSNFGIDIAPQYSWSRFLVIVAAVYLVPLLVMIFITEKYLQQRNQQKANLLQSNLNEAITSNPSQADIIKITSDSTSVPPLELNTANFIYAASDNNYVMLHYLNSEIQLDKQLLRISLKKLESQLIEQSDIIRCHKSYLVNRQHILNISGNARSLYLKINHSDFQVPVSRSFDRSQLS